jgi:endonuclease I
MSNKKQIVVEWLIEKLKSQGLLIGEPDNLIAVKQAKEMEKNNIINAAARGYLSMTERFNLEDAKDYGQQYYNNTYGK